LVVGKANEGAAQEFRSINYYMDGWILKEATIKIIHPLMLYVDALNRFMSLSPQCIDK
jgi:hypothetical protein